MSGGGTTARVTAAALFAGLAACAGVLFTAPPGSTVSLSVNPSFVPANGGVSDLTVIVIEPAGTPVSDGTVVLFFTDLGTVDPQAKTKNGIARAHFVSDSRSGPAIVTAISGGAAAPAPAASSSPGTGGGGTTAGGSGSDSKTIMVGNVNVKAVRAVADPPRITGSNSTHVFATVFDTNGNPIANVPVYFSVVTDPATEFFDVQGPVYTNNSGVAEDVMRTRRQTAGNATVKASAVGPAGFVDSAVLTIPIL